ncbi:MAG TPA: hypothetical protein VM430_03200 [Microbacterium sp.]|nr:hypothetical protein [Microbacterium sp.]
MQDALTALVRAAGTTPTPTPSTVDPNLVTPGPWGFVVIAFVAVAVILLVWDMMRRIRRGRVRADIREELEAEQQAAAALESTEIDDESTDAGDDAEGTPPRG